MQKITFNACGLSFVALVNADNEIRSLTCNSKDALFLAASPEIWPRIEASLRAKLTAQQSLADIAMQSLVTATAVYKLTKGL